MLGVYVAFTHALQIPSLLLYECIQPHACLWLPVGATKRCMHAWIYMQLLNQSQQRSWPLFIFGLGI
jgi:hypothetical protein